MYENSFLLMKSSGAVLLLLLFAACAGEAAGPGKTEAVAVTPGSIQRESPGEIAAELERIAEIERSGFSFPGLGLAESALREQSGDFAGAVIAAYKELSWAYGNGSADKTQVLEGLVNALALLGDVSPDFNPARGGGAVAVRGCMAFAREDWEQARELLLAVLPEDEEPDSFLRWMLLVCSNEEAARTGAGADERRAGRSAYGAIRARYALYPEYWYRGARAFSGPYGDDNIAVSYAEQCINTSPEGPFALECRKILALHAGVPGESHSGIRTKAETENVIRNSVSMNDPLILKELFPLLALPDNPYTFFALGAMNVLSAIPDYRNFFTEEALKSPGRLGERLHFISRGQV